MKDKNNRRAIRWGRRYLTLDKYMSGGFWPLFLRTLGLSAVLFVVLWSFTSWIAGWDMMEAFTQMSNPDRHLPQNELTPDGEWIAIVVMNLFGLLVLNGVVLTLLVNWVSNRRDRHVKGEARYNYVFGRKFSVIIGGHKIVSALARGLMDEGDIEYVVIQTRRDAEEVRREIAAEIDDKEAVRRVIIYSGDRSSPHELGELHLDRANEIYLIGEPAEIDGTNHDAINMQTWRLINRLYPVASEKRTDCHVMFEYQSTFSAFQSADLTLEQSRKFNFMPFSLYEAWAQQVLSCRKTVGDEPYYLPLDGKDGIGFESTERVHLIVVGMSKMGVALAIEAAHMYHFPNFNNPQVGRPRTLITFIDRDARQEMFYFMGRYKALFRLARHRYVAATDSLMPEDIYVSGRDSALWLDPMTDQSLNSPYYGGYLGDDFIDVDFEFIQGDVALPSVQKYIADACADKNSRTTVAVCFPASAEAMSAALYFNPSVYDNVQQIWVQQAGSGALVDAVSRGETGLGRSKYRKLRPFGMLEQSDYLRFGRSRLPKMVAYAYDCMDRNTTLAVESKKMTPDELMAAVERNWREMNQKGGKSVMAKRWSNIYCANSFESKMRSVGYGADMTGFIVDEYVLETLAKVEHNRWVIEQLLMGFRPKDSSYAGRPVDASLKEELKKQNIHPDLVSNERLGAVKSYDLGIAAIIPFALAKDRLS